MADSVRRQEKTAMRRQVAARCNQMHFGSLWRARCRRDGGRWWLEVDDVVLTGRQRKVNSSNTGGSSSKRRKFTVFMSVGPCGL